MTDYARIAMLDLDILIKGSLDEPFNILRNSNYSLAGVRDTGWAIGRGSEDIRDQINAGGTEVMLSSCAVSSMLNIRSYCRSNVGETQPATLSGSGRILSQRQQLRCPLSRAGHAESLLLVDVAQPQCRVWPADYVQVAAQGALRSILFECQRCRGFALSSASLSSHTDCVFYAVVHYAGTFKPWHTCSESSSPLVCGTQIDEGVRLWRAAFVRGLQEYNLDVRDVLQGRSPAEAGYDWLDTVEA